MDRERDFAENQRSSVKKSASESDRASEPGSGAETRSLEVAYFEKLLIADATGLCGKPLTTDEILMIGGTAFEPLFHEPPIGPIPEYLTPHLSVHGCIAEYEEKYEELDRWKALQLNRWLQERIGEKWSIAGETYVLQAEREEAVASERFLFKLIEAQAKRDGPTAGDL